MKEALTVKLKEQQLKRLRGCPQIDSQNKWWKLEHKGGDLVVDPDAHGKIIYTRWTEQHGRSGSVAPRHPKGYQGNEERSRHSVNVASIFPGIGQYY